MHVIADVSPGSLSDVSLTSFLMIVMIVVVDVSLCRALMYKQLVSFP